MRWLVLILLGLPARAEEPPACFAIHAGQVACIAGRLCECRFARGGSLTGTRDGHRWDCGILRPSCGTGPLSPPALPPPVELILPLPPRTPWR